ncbi:group II intron reverse transcriptase/maturase [Bacillus pseudomycoides]|uniref:group II intron reverse transcriptase/maturase n=1 Tax=Bacillus pseudomycoides TaxID=64104 RepID=UPI000BF64170|nr:group II intron reverse transcriptase/maturase [Bacillus pseudomycoides]PGA62210.1 group II intron reverse transcriptase/maturase [Bacillus pseudomycoides]
MSTKLRYYEYYNMQETFDWLYQRSVENRTKGIDLYKIITSENNILLAYRMIKSNTGSKTAGVDNLTIDEYKMKNKQVFIEEIRKTLKDYRPQAVRRIEIPKPNGKTRPLGIPTMRDRLIQQMFKQVLEPICEAKFYNHSYGFRPNRSTHHALSRCVHLVNIAKCHHVVDIDIQGFFDNVNHARLLRQIYTIGIKDKRVLAIIGKMLKAPISNSGIQDKGTPQGAILSPLLSNIVLNDLDWWIATQWEHINTRYPYSHSPDKYRFLRRTTKLKEMYIVRYADDFKVFTKNHKHAIKIFHAVKGYLNNYLKLEISKEKSQITNLRKRNSEFLGFEIKAVPKKKRYVANTHISKKQIKLIKANIKSLIKEIQRYPIEKTIYRYNSYVLGIHNYYRHATHVHSSFKEIAYSCFTTLYNRLKYCGSWEVPRSPPQAYTKLYSNNYMMIRIGRMCLYPLKDIKWKLCRIFNPKICNYTKAGRKVLHKQLKGNVSIELKKLLRLQSFQKENLEYMDNRISKYSMQNGICAITGVFLKAEEVHCHHILPRYLGGTDEFKNLTIVHIGVHRLIHATQQQTINEYLKIIQLDGKQLDKLNKYRKKCNLTEIHL